MDTTSNGQAKGADLIGEGYRSDSFGFALDPGAFYEYEAETFVGITALWRSGLKRPKDPEEIKKDDGQPSSLGWSRPCY